MVWAISIVCVSLSCEPIPIVSGWFYSERDCVEALQLIDTAWQPTMGFYEMKCYSRVAT